MQHTILAIDGMNTEGCADLVQTVLNNVSGVNNVRVSLLHNQASVQFDERHTTPVYLAKALDHAGYPAQAVQERSGGGCCGGGCGG